MSILKIILNFNGQINFEFLRFRRLHAPLNCFDFQFSFIIQTVNLNKIYLNLIIKQTSLLAEQSCKILHNKLKEFQSQLEFKTMQVILHQTFSIFTQFLISRLPTIISFIINLLFLTTENNFAIHSNIVVNKNFIQLKYQSSPYISNYTSSVAS